MVSHALGSEFLFTFWWWRDRAGSAETLQRCQCVLYDVDQIRKQQLPP